MLQFGRDICSHLPTAEAREWLVTNGIGGYAMGTIANLPTRRYHGLLIAALQPPVGRTLLLAKLDETATYAARDFPLHSARWAPTGPFTATKLAGRGLQVDPPGFHHLESFRLIGTVPVWTYVCADAVLERRVWMQQGANITYVHYLLRHASGPLTLNAKALVNHRDHHGSTHAAEWRMQIDQVADGLRVQAYDAEVPLYLLSERAQAAPRHEWYRGYFLGLEAHRGQDPLDDNLYAGLFTASLHVGESVTLVASTDPDPQLDGQTALALQQTFERRLLVAAGLPPARPFATGHTTMVENPTPASLPPTLDNEPDRGAPHRAVQEVLAAAGLAPNGSQPCDPIALPSVAVESVQQLALAAGQFIVRRALPGELDGRSVIAGYPWFGDWGRDTMISLPGLALVTGRHAVAAQILRTFALHVDHGMLPNRFPDAGTEPEYNTMDATLWYFEAIRAYRAAVLGQAQGSSPDDTLLSDLFPVLQEIVDWHLRGTRYNIRMDPEDGLLYGGQPGVQLTWMDAKVGEWVVTPRIGKPVEINALWYNALRLMGDFADALGRPGERYDELANRAGASFARFWNQDVGYCFDVIDGPQGNDASLRPNQLVAVSLAHSPLTPEQQQAVVDVCGRHLVTSHGLRSLAPGDPAFVGQYGGDRQQRDTAYHQGTVWAWLIGPFVSAHLRVYGDRQRARAFLWPLMRQLADHGVGSVSEIFDGDPPFTARGCIAQAWSVAELLRAWKATSDPE